MRRLSPHRRVLARPGVHSGNSQAAAEKTGESLHGIRSRTAGLQFELRRLCKAEELKKRIWFTLGALIVYRLGTYIPMPGIDPEALLAAFEQQAGGILGMFNMFAGGAVERMAIFALGIMPYISASIIMQLMTSVSPTLEQLKKEGEQGRKVINQYTRYGTVLLATMQAYGIAVGLEAAQGPSSPIRAGSSAFRPSSRWSAAPCS
jgi:preprotein translocase subunit SecY